MTRVCFVAENAYPAISHTSRGDIGGMETQAWAFARGLQSLGVCQTHFVVSSPEHFSHREHDHVIVHNRREWIEHVRRNVATSCDIDSSRARFRIHHWNIQLLWQLPVLALSKPFRSPFRSLERLKRFYERLPVDVVIAFGASSLTTHVLSSVKNAGKIGILSCASNDDLRSEYRESSHYVSAYGDRGDEMGRGLRLADRLLVQTTTQQKLAKENLGLDSCYLPNPIDPKWDEWIADRQRLLQPIWHLYPVLKTPFVLWTGRTDTFHKRPEMALQIAKQLKNISMVMVMAVTDPELDRRLRMEAPANVHFIPPMAHPAFVALMSTAAAFLNTGSSSYEGFPNVYLQAGIAGVPVVAADADFGILSETGIGQSYADDKTAMAAALQTLVQKHDQLRLERSQVANRVREEFSSHRISRKLWEIISGMNS